MHLFDLLTGLSDALTRRSDPALPAAAAVAKEESDMNPCNAGSHMCVALSLFALAPAVAAQTQQAMTTDSGAAFKTADHELNQVYHQVLKKYADDTGFIARFRTAQRAWVSFRDAEVAARFPDKDPMVVYGSVYPICVADLKAELTTKRVKELQLWIDGVQEGELCAGSVGFR